MIISQIQVKENFPIIENVKLIVGDILDNSQII